MVEKAIASSPLSASTWNSCEALPPEAAEDARVGVVHRLVGFRAAFVGEVEGVGVLHQELARAHHAEARADLVAELGVDLVEVDRQLPVAAQLLAREVGDHLLGGGRVAVVGFLAVLDLQQLAAELLPAPGFLPQLARLHGRHHHLERAGAVHLLAHDRLHLAQHAQAQGRPGVEAGGKLADHAGAQHQPVAGDLGVAGDFTGGVEVERGQAHGRFQAGKPPL
jgi:hypothetical protein